MKKLLIWQLLIPLFVLSGISFWIASILNDAPDYASIFLNLSTDFIMIIITIWYVDKVLKRHEYENWKDVDHLLQDKLYNLANSTIDTICSPIGLHDTNLPEYKLFLNKLENQKEEKGIHRDYYGDFAKKFTEGLYITNKENYYASKTFTDERLRQAKFTSNEIDKISENLINYSNEASQLIDLYSARLTPKQLKSLIAFQLNTH